MIGIVVSRADEASERVGDRLLDLAGWDEREDHRRVDAEGGGTYYRNEAFELREFDELHLHLDRVADAFDDPDLVAFVSRHAGETGPLLTAHFTGNFGPAEYGGADGELARACPNAHARVLDALREYAPGGYDVGMECTHHGPSEVGAPAMFVEVGSGEEQWRDSDAAGAVARAVLDLGGVDPHRERTVVGFGGGHYAPRFERIARETDRAVGHVAADWGLEALAELRGDRASEVIDAAFERSGATRAVVEGDRPQLRETIEDLGYRVVSETWVRATVDVPLALVDRLESDLSSVESGLRFGDAARAGVQDYEVYEPDDDLLADANGVDRDRTRAEVADRAVAFETAEDGNRVAGRIAVPAGGVDDLVDALAAVLEERFEAVEREGAELVAVERAFDPEKAHALGIPEGPKFGRLAAGEPVEMDGETIPPDAVHEERTRRYRV